MPGTTKNGLFRNALIAIGERPVDTGAEVESARSLVEVYDRTVEDCLSAGSWNFGTITTVLKGDTGLATSDTGLGVYGPRYGFTMPSNYVRTVAISGDEYFSQPLSGYTQENNQIQADTTPIYLKYISSDTGAGLELTSWPRAFTRYVELELAARVCDRLTQSASKTDQVEGRRDKARRTALNHDAMNEQNPKFKPDGSWTQSRSGRSAGRDRGLRSRLTS